MAKPLYRLRKRRFQPLIRPDPALVAKQMNFRPARIPPRAQLANQPHCLFDLLRIGVALFYQAHRQPMRAEDEMNARAVRELPQNRTDAFDQRLDVERMLVKMVDRTLRRAAVVLAPFRTFNNAPPLFQTA